jgi:anti-sigma-K factor RskA
MAELLTPEERDALAAELALGVLAGEERAQALRLKLADPGFAAAVAAWEARLDPLGEAFGEVPPPAIWPAIERRLGTSDSVTQLRRWRIATVATGALAASLALILVLRPVSAPIEIVRAPEHVVMAELDGGEKGALFAANYDPANGMLRIKAMRMPESDLMPELWVIPADGVPRSLGLVSPTGMMKMPVPMGHRKLMQDGAVLAVTMEPRDGAPHDKPSSAPVAAGKISTI